MSTDSSKFHPREVILLEAKANHQHEPGDSSRIENGTFDVNVSVEFSVDELTIHESGSEGFVTALFAASETLAHNKDEEFVRTNHISATYRVRLSQESVPSSAFEASSEFADEIIKIALEFAYPYFRVKLRELSHDVFIQPFGSPPTWSEMHKQLISGRSDDQAPAASAPSKS